LRKALELNPDLSLAHHLFAHLEVEAGHAREAMVRLLGRARASGSDPELFAGLVHACRYCGLLDASVAAHERARRLDPRVVTTAAHTFLMRGDLDRAIEADSGRPAYVRAIALARSGRTAEAIEIMTADVAEQTNPQMRNTLGGILAMLNGRLDESRAYFEKLRLIDFRDPEGLYYWATTLVQVEDHEGALDLLRRAVDGGFHTAPALVRDPWLDPVRGRPEFVSILRRAEEKMRAAQESFH